MSNYLKKFGWVLLAVVALKLTIHIFTFGFADFDPNQVGIHVAVAVVGLALTFLDWTKHQAVEVWNGVRGYISSYRKNDE